MIFKDISEGERPRERMLAAGPRVLSSSELIAILLRSGTRGINAHELAHQLLSAADGSLVKLSAMSMEKMLTVNGLGPVKAQQVMAAFELGRRFLAESSELVKKPVTSPRQVFSLMIPELKGVMHEEFWVLFLNRSNYVLAKRKMTAGGLNSTVIDSKAVLLDALELKASSLILVHNHPSGNPRPGVEDIKQTTALKRAVESFDIGLTDHVVICDDCFYSFADEAITPCGDGL